MLSLVIQFFLASACRLRPGGVIINWHTLTRRQTLFQLDVLSRWFEFISLAELPYRLARKSARPFCLLTLDDGKRSQFTEMAPALESRQVPAVFYVTTDLLSTGGLFWFDSREALVKKLGFCPTGLELAALKKLPFGQLIERLERACDSNGLEVEIESDDLRPMSWEQARELAGRGFTVGAHGRSHAILTNETKERACAEIEGSLAAVAAETGKPCSTFAFPNGNGTPELARHALRCGATSLMTTEPTWVDGRSDLWRLPRVQLFGGFSRSRIELKIALAAIGGCIPNPDGSGRVRPHMGRRQAPMARVPGAG
jgi:peptidoglycan/xylan/chitin deacetylase (PgdA/CDA1 family)